MRIRLREVRERKLMTQEELAQRSGLTQTSISALERGVHAPRISTIRKLAAALEVDPDELIVREP
jgi:transcriptional regulator with XRE-family HTH domain